MAKQNLLVATSNSHKIAEFRTLFGDMGLSFVTFDDVPGSRDVEVVEDCETFEGNAIKKALVLSAAMRRPVLAEDSGFVVEALGGEPGVYSARYLGANTPQDERHRHILTKLEGLSGRERRAGYRSVIAIVDAASGFLRTFHGTCHGEVGLEPRGTGGFGYDPLFIPNQERSGQNRTFAEMTADEKHVISHRGRAVKALQEELSRPESELRVQIHGSR